MRASRPTESASGDREPGLPTGLPLVLDPDTERRGGELVGGSPRRRMVLSATGQNVLDKLLDAGATTLTEQILGRRLTDANLAHPEPSAFLPPTSRPSTDIALAEVMTVVVPVRGRPEALARCLAALPADVRVVVARDDGPRPRGPAATRNRGAATVTTAFVAFVDSDVTLEPETLEQLLPHFRDPLVAAVAPRVRSSRRRGHAIDRYLLARSPLDMGPLPACVRPGTRVGYVPSTVLVIRRDALGAGFDPALRYGEDVDLVWRLLGLGHRVRYVPDVVVRHDEPTTIRDALLRRARYGTAAALLHNRHPQCLHSVLRGLTHTLVQIPDALQDRPATIDRALWTALVVADELAYASGAMAGALRRTVDSCRTPAAAAAESKDERSLLSTEPGGGSATSR